MTEPTPEQNEIPVPPGEVAQEAAPIVVPARKNSKLEQLHALYYSLKAEKDEADKKFKAVCDAIKLEVTQTDAEGRKFALTSKAGVPSLAVTYAVSNRFDSTRFKKEKPELYVDYLKQSHSWSIRPVADGGE